MILKHIDSTSIEYIFIIKKILFIKLATKSKLIQYTAFEVYSLQLQKIVIQAIGIVSISSRLAYRCLNHIGQYKMRVNKDLLGVNITNSGLFDYKVYSLIKLK